MKIKAIFFDFGGVIQRTEYQAPRQKLAEKFGMEYDDIDKFIFNNPTAHQASVGEIKIDEHWQVIAKKLKLGKDELAKFQSEFFGGDVIDYELVQFIRSLRPAYKTGLISNAWSDMRQYLISKKLDDAFDSLTISAEVKIAKPDAKIYYIALDSLGVKASESIFVDDVPANIEACEKLGMHGVLFRDVNDVMGELRKMLKV
ncbi:MAG: putative hydrolase [Chloroflexi bacterium OLB14]|nr:MAG: putative hydrolase [Chloroflexi bacterium OLB14]